MLMANVSVKASINGITLRRLELFRSPDGGGINADVYMDGVRIGDIHDSGRGGGTMVNIDKQFKSELQKRMVSYFTKYPTEFATDDIFLGDELVNLTENEKAFKKKIKEGFTIFALLWKASRSETLFDNRYMNTPVQIFFRTEQGLTNTINTKGYKDFQIFKSVDDFCINTMNDQDASKAKENEENIQTNIQTESNQFNHVAYKYFGRS